MLDSGLMREITTEAELRGVLGFPAGRAVTKERTALHPRDRQWLAASPFCLVATAGADGSCDVSPKGDPPGFTHVLDDTTIAIPDRYGNRRADGFRNILANPHVGLLYLVPGRKETLRINGRARLIREAPFFDQMIVKAFMRSQLWEPQTWAPDAFPSHAQLVRSVQPTGETLEELERHYGPSYAKGLYG
jgi:predicted pyridoxine 5'-phosphate oxidase superfamily flavin-nucleotide-binding protein